MRRTYLKAVPRLIPPPDTVANGIERTPDEWAEAIARLRPRLLALGYRELCGLLRKMYLQDLFCLVVNVPYSHELLAHLQEGLSEPVWEGLRDDCEKQGAGLLGDLAAGVFARVNESLTALEASRATKDQLEQLQILSRQMLVLEDEAFKFCLDEMPIAAMDALFVVTGGLESEWSRRTLGAFSERAREMVQEDYPDKSTEPIKSEDAADCIENLPALMKGQPWPEDENAQTPEEYAAWLAELDAHILKAKNRPKLSPWQELKLKIACWKCDRMDMYYEMQDWFRSKFGSKK